MCNYWEIVSYNCGHELAAPNWTKSTFCLFGDPRICEQELGRFRILDTHVNGWCGRCEQVARRMRGRAGKGNFRTPTSTYKEREHQRGVRSGLVTSQFMPARVPSQSRLNQLNGIAGRALGEQIQRPDSFAAPVIAWVIRYIASLPPWLDRPALAGQLRPWFAGLLDEEHQICVRPALRGMNCENYLDDVMVWTYS